MQSNPNSDLPWEQQALHLVIETVQQALHEKSPAEQQSLQMALMTLRLWELSALALPLLGLLFGQAVLMVVYAVFVTFPVLGRNYDAAVIAAGHCGFGLGATPTAIANMQAVTDRFGSSPLAFLVVPMVGAFFIDIANAIVIKLLETASDAGYDLNSISRARFSAEDQRQLAQLIGYSVDGYNSLPYAEGHRK